MDRVPKRAASPTLSESSKKSLPEFLATRANMTSTCTVRDDENDVHSSAGFSAVLVPMGQIGIPHLPVTETTHDLFEDLASDHRLAHLAFKLMQAAMSDGAEGVDGASALGPVISRRVAQEFLLPDRRSGKLDFFFPASDDDISTAVIRPVPRLLTDVIERCSLM